MDACMHEECLGAEGKESKEKKRNGEEGERERRRRKKKGDGRCVPALCTLGQE